MPKSLDIVRILVASPADVQQERNCLKQVVKEIYREAVQARRPFALEYRLRRHDGEYRWVVAHGSVWEDAPGQFAGYLGACYDVTECKRAEEQIRFRDLLLNQVR